MRRIHGIASVALSVAWGTSFCLFADERSASVRDYRDLALTVDIVDPVRVLSTNKAVQLEDEVRKAYVKLAPAVVRIWKHNDKGIAFDERGNPAMGGFSGVIIDRSGLVLTCAHHGLAPESQVTFELADGKRVAGTMVGRFQVENLPPLHEAPDLGLAQIGEPGEWPAASLSDGDEPAAGVSCLAIGYPGALGPGRPPLLRFGRVLPRFPGRDWLETTTTNMPGDSGGPLFDLAGRVVGVLSGEDGVANARYQSIAPLQALRGRLERGEIVAGARRGIIATRGRNYQPAAFVPAPDLEDRVQQVGKSVIQVLDGPHEVASGLIVDPDGWAVTKASLVGDREEWSCRLFYVVDKVIAKGTVVAVSREHDIALMKLDVKKRPVAPWAPAPPEIGTLVLSILGRTTAPHHFAVVGSSATREPHDGVPQIPLAVKPSDSGTLFVRADGWPTAEFDHWRNRLESGDVVTHLNGIPVPTFSEFGKVMDRLIYASGPEEAEVDYHTPARASFAGDWVAVRLRRGTEERTTRIPKIHSSTEGGMIWYSSPRSLRRDAFPAVFAHDGEVRPEKCGGPVVDLAGRVVGLNIARADTTRTLAIPTDVLRIVIAELRARVGKGE